MPNHAHGRTPSDPEHARPATLLGQGPAANPRRVLRAEPPSPATVQPLDVRTNRRCVKRTPSRRSSSRQGWTSRRCRCGTGRSRTRGDHERSNATESGEEAVVDSLRSWPAAPQACVTAWHHGWGEEWRPLRRLHRRRPSTHLARTPRGGPRRCRSPAIPPGRSHWGLSVVVSTCCLGVLDRVIDRYPGGDVTPLNYGRHDG